MYIIEIGSDIMYKDNEIGLEIFNKYNELVSLLKQKNAVSSKLSELETLLMYFNNNFENFNFEEKKLIKNTIMIASGITVKVNNNYSYVQERLKVCLNLIKELEDKQKEPIK